MTDDLMLAPEIQQFRHYHATVRIRRGDGWEVRPEAEALDGQRRLFMAAWMMDDDDPYPGDWAMTFEDRREPVTWIASGDLVDVIEADAMLVRAERIEQELMKAATEFSSAGRELDNLVSEAHGFDETARLLNRAALLIQQLRLALEAARAA